MDTKPIITSFRKLAARLLVFVAVALVSSTVTVSQRAVLNSSDSREFGVEVVQVPELPLSVREVVLTKTRDGYLLKCLLSNNSADRIVGLDYLLLVIDSNNLERSVVKGTEGFKLKGYATRTLISQRPLRLEVGDGYRLFLVPHRVFSGDSVWEVLKVNKVLEAHASGDYSITPEVVRFLNLLDAPPRPRIIY